MLFFAHRINTSEELIKIPTSFGIELDLRDKGDRLILQHDPFKDGEDFDAFLVHYKHSGIILNIKSEGIEWRVLDTLKKFNITNYFFLDCSLPMIVKLIASGESKIAVRYSLYEPKSYIMKFKGIVEWCWIDYYDSMYPSLDSEVLESFKCCLVSPALHGKITEVESNANKYKSIPHAICDKIYNIDLWLSINK
jgi:hypothetical protein